MATNLCRVLPVCNRLALKGRIRMSLPAIASFNQQMVNEINGNLSLIIIHCRL
jgi:hypothetical protein